MSKYTVERAPLDRRKSPCSSRGFDEAGDQRVGRGVVHAAGSIVWSMGWYPAVGRPLFFALPPETAHRLAGFMLGLPLPWRRIGHALDDPRLRVELAADPLRNPIGLSGRVRQDLPASGCTG